MAPQPRTLADVIELAFARTGAESARQLEEHAHRQNFKLTHTTINNLRRGVYPSRPKNDTLRALAQLSGVPLKHVRDLAGLPPVASVPFASQLPPDVDILNPRQRRVLVEMARTLIETEKRTQQPAPVEEPIGRRPSGAVGATLDDLGFRRRDSQEGESVQN